jgi:hypothetical protein
MVYRKLGWLALALFAATNIPFWLRMTNIIVTRSSGYVWANIIFAMLGILTVIVSVAFFISWLLHLTRTWNPGTRRALILASSLALAAGEAFCLLFGCLTINFGGQ